MGEINATLDRKESTGCRRQRARIRAGRNRGRTTKAPCRTAKTARRTQESLCADFKQGECPAQGNRQPAAERKRLTNLIDRLSKFSPPRLHRPPGGKTAEAARAARSRPGCRQGAKENNSARGWRGKWPRVRPASNLPARAWSKPARIATNPWPAMAALPGSEATCACPCGARFPALRVAARWRRHLARPVHQGGLR